MTLGRVCVPLVVFAAALLAASVAHSGVSAARPDCPTPAGRPLGAGEILPALRRLVPKHYRGLTNQAGGGAWRGYETLAEFTLARPMRLDHTYRAVAVRACGMRVADRSWVAIISFPRAQTVEDGTSAAYLVRTARRITIWRDRFIQP